MFGVRQGSADAGFEVVRAVRVHALGGVVTAERLPLMHEQQRPPDRHLPEYHLAEAALGT